MTGSTEPGDARAEHREHAAPANGDEIVETSFAHLRQLHPDMAGTDERERVLFMAQRFVRT